MSQFFAFFRNVWHSFNHPSPTGFCIEKPSVYQAAANRQEMIATYARYAVMVFSGVAAVAYLNEPISLQGTMHLAAAMIDLVLVVLSGAVMIVMHLKQFRSTKLAELAKQSIEEYDEINRQAKQHLPRSSWV